MEAAATDPLKPARSLAMLITLLFGAIVGGTLSPVPAQARSQIASASLDNQAPAILVVKTGKVAAKAQRPAPGPALLPTGLSVVHQGRVIAVGSGAETPVTFNASPSVAPYHARAPPPAA